MRFICTFLILSALCIAIPRSEAADDIAPLLSPRGFTDTKGGADGTILRVTNLDADGPGSLRDALEAEGPRLVIFEVGGVIDLKKIPLKIRNPYLTIAGETAPSPGITLIRGQTSISTHDVVIRHIRFRPGDAGAPKRSGWEPDGLSTTTGAHDVIIDHCSFSWAVDENLSASGPRTEGPEVTSHRITFSNNIIAEALNDSSHSKGPHSKGTLVHDFCQKIAIIGNLYAHNVDRNPYFKAYTTGIIVNNVIYNPVSKAIYLNYVESEWRGTPLDPVNAQVSIVGNLLRYGPDTPDGLPLVQSRGDAWMDDNLTFDRDGNHAPLAEGEINVLDERPVWPEELKPLPSTEIEAYVIVNAGARPKDRDEVDKRIIRDFRHRAGHIINSQDEVGGYPQQQMTTRALKVPEEEIDEWLQQFTEKVE